MRFLTAFAKKLFSSFAISSQFVNKELLSPSVRFIYSGRWIFFWQEGFHGFLETFFICNAFLLSVCEILLFRFSQKSNTLTSLFANSFRFSSLLFCKKRFFKLSLVLVALEISLLINGLWLDRISHFFLACLWKISVQIVENASILF